MTRAAGSYIEDPETGVVTLVHRTEGDRAPLAQPPDPAPAASSPDPDPDEYIEE